MTLEVFVLFSLILFSLGLYAVVVRKNLIAMLIGVELMLNAASLSFMAFNRFGNPEPSVGQIIVLFVIGLAAAEAAIALSIILTVHRSRKTIDVDRLDDLEG